MSKQEENILSQEEKDLDKEINQAEIPENTKEAVVQFSSSIVSWVLLAGILMVQSMPQILLAGIVLFAASTLFSFITLPVEINASGRALAWMSNAGITNAFNHKAAEDALKSAAYTYVVAALSSLATLIYYVSIYMGRRD